MVINQGNSMAFITSDEAEARAWLSKLWEKEAQELRDIRAKSKNGEYDFY